MYINVLEDRDVSKSTDRRAILYENLLRLLLLDNKLK